MHYKKKKLKTKQKTTTRKNKTNKHLRGFVSPLDNRSINELIGRLPPFFFWRGGTGGKVLTAVCLYPSGVNKQ